MEVKPEPQPAGAASACRGCGARAGPGCRELAHEYSWLGVREVYADMLRETFQIQLSQTESGSCARYICDACIVRLRDASSFKRQVLNVEQRFLKRLLCAQGDKLLETTDAVTIKIEARNEAEGDGSAWADDMLEFEECDIVSTASTKTENMKKEPEPLTATVLIKPVAKKFLNKETSSKNISPSFMTNVAKALSTRRTKIIVGKPLNKTVANTSKFSGRLLKLLTAPRNSLSTPRNKLSTSDPLNTPKATKSLPVITSKNVLNITRTPVKLLKTPNMLITSKDPLKPTINVLNESTKPRNLSNLPTNGSQSQESLLKLLLATNSKAAMNKKALALKAKNRESNLNAKTVSSKLRFSLKKKAKVTVDSTADEKPSTAIQRFNEDRRLEREVIRQNVSKVLKNTTVLPFGFLNGSFKCFYCTDKFLDFDKLRTHTDEAHDDLQKATYKICAVRDLLNVDITTLKCRVCDMDFEDLDSIKEHLTSAHKIDIDMKHKDDMMPFKLRGNQYICHVCNVDFHTFRILSIHVNTHFANYMCEVCGQPFMSIKRCRDHETTHQKGHFPCHKCDKIFTSINSRNSHCMEHRGSKYRCPQCYEPFEKYLDRTLHMSQVHNFTRKFVCTHPECAKEFIHKPHFNAHVRTHLEQTKKAECLECGMRFQNNHKLKKHMVTHTGERPFQCKVCGKRYGLSGTLREHMRIHNNDRRHVCAECGLGFVQKCSLKGHMKSRHPLVEWPTT